MVDQNILFRCFSGKITVIMKGGGQMQFDNCGMPSSILSAVQELDMLIQRKPIFCDDLGNPPYEVLSFDDANKVIVVRRKK